ncbi:MAG: tetratricopeptide repeat protein [Spirochaetes bacterium]|nr:tetratricopeptide repeat protein [Spirochaetota bacterium]
MKRIVIAIVVLLLTGCATTAYRDIPFDYSQVLTKEYRFGTGRSIPLTFDRKVNVSGSITADGKYFVYASNKERNNFDIYLRALNDITTVRITMHPARDFSPDVSVDGKWCAFVSTRDDPEGDIFIMKLDPETMIAQSDQEAPSTNITVIRDPLSGAIVPVRDASPCFSPDGKLIAFSSTRDGEESIYIMGRDGKGIKKITEGMQPRFSNDGNTLIFVKKNQKGTNVFTVDLTTGQINQITHNEYLELSPCFGKTRNEIYFMRIEQDTNNDGIVNTNDASILYAYDVSKKEEYPLTLVEEPSATPRWVPYADGVIVYSIVEGEYINIAMIPHTGIIPKQKNALRQYELALKYKEDYDDHDRYLRCLFATYYFFKEAGDAESGMIIAKALYELSYYKQYSFVQTILAAMAKTSKPAFIYARLRSVKDKEKISLLENSIKELSAQNNEKETPFFMEELADLYMSARMFEKAQAVYSGIIAHYPHYARVMYVRYKVGGLVYNDFAIPEEWISVLQSSYTYLKNAITIQIIDSAKNIAIHKRYSNALDASKSYTVPIIKAIMQYIAATSLIELQRNDEAIPLLKQGLENTKKLDVSYFLINIALGQLYYDQKSDEWVVYYEAAVNNYQAQWKQDIRPIIEQLSQYFEQTGQRLISEGNYKDAASLYKRYITMNTLLLLKRRYRDIYSNNAPGAHTGYINAMLGLSQDSSIHDLEKEYLNRLPIARMDFDKAHIFGLGYIYVKWAQALALSPGQMNGKSSQEFEELLLLFKKALRHIDWSLFIDDMFVDAYLLKGWIYQYIDELRSLFPSKKRVIDTYFSEYLWEKSIPLYEKALAANNEILFPQREADIHCNIGNIYFLLKNFNLAARHYDKAIEFKKAFSTLKEEALFYYHYGYCMWQKGNYAQAFSSMQQSYRIYKAIAQKNEPAMGTLFVLYKYFALFERMQGNYEKAIEWYTHALSQLPNIHSDESSSRIYIEIAECYRKMDNDNQALTYLELAKRSLQKEKSVQYKIGWKFGGFGPVYFYDLGQDTVVIGEGKIVSHLSGMQMEILINNMQADILTKSGKLKEAIAQYMAIAELTKKQKSSLMTDAYFTALYNAGYCYALSGSMQKALELYDSALAIAQDKNIAIDKIYQILVQWAYCYTSTLNSDPEKLMRIDGALKKIEQLKNSIFDKVYNSLVDEYTKKMKAQKKKPAEQDIAALKEQAEKQVEAYSIKFDALIALLYMHKAAMMQQDRKASDDSSDVIKANSMYREAERLFSKAIVYYGNEAVHQEFVIKLLINRGICKIRSGQYREGYDDIISARFKANKIMSKDLLWDVEATLWDMAYRHVEIKQFIDNPEKLIIGVLSRVELLPPLYRMKKEFVQYLYDAYTNELLQNKRYKEAYTIQARKQVITMAFNALSIPHFYNKEDTAFYGKFLRTCFTIQDLEQKLTKAILAEEATSNIEKLQSHIVSQYSILAAHRSSAPLYLLPYLGVYTPTSPDIPVVHFYMFDSKLYGWLVYNNTINWRLISDSPYSERLAEDVEKCIQPFGGKIYCIINSTLITIYNTIRTSVFYGMGCVPVISRVIDAEKLMWLPGNVVATDKGLQKIEKTTINITDSEYIVDTDNPDIDVTPQYCYSNKIECSALFKYMDVLKIEELMLLADAAVYSHIASVIVYSDRSSENMIASFIKGEIHPSDFKKARAVVLGKVPDSIEQQLRNVQIVGQKKQSEFTDALIRGDYDSAQLALLRWRRAGLTEKEYFEKKVLVLIYQNKLDEALQLLRSQPHNARAISYSVYIHLLKGDIQSAEKLLSNTYLVNTFDYRVYESIIKGFKYKEKIADINEISQTNTSIVSINQLLLLFAQAAYLLGEEKKALELVKVYKPDYIPSMRELLVAYYLGYPLNHYTHSIAYQMVKKVTEATYSSNIAKAIIEFGTLSHFAILEIIKQSQNLDDEKWQQIMLVTEKSDQMCWLDEQFNTVKIAEILNVSNPLRTLEYISAANSKKDVMLADAVVLKSIVAYQKNNNFTKAYASCKSLKKVPYALEKIWYAYYVYSAIMLGKTDEAYKLLNDSTLVTKDAFLYRVFNICIQLQKISADKTVESTLLQTIAQNIDELMSSLRSDAIQLYYTEYKYLFDKLINYAISYTMSRGNQREALRYAEMHKMIMATALFNENSRYQSIYNELISKNFPISDIQKIIQRHKAILYIAKNENDIFAWIITRTFIQPVRLPNVYTKLYAIVSEYYEKVGLLQQAFDKEAEINSIMKPIINEISGYSDIIVVPDAYTEAIPFEIIQFNRYDTTVSFMPSLMAALNDAKPVPPIAWINVSNTKKDLVAAALKQSGLPYTFKAIPQGIAIDESLIEYNSDKKRLMMKDDMLQSNYLLINVGGKSSVPYYYLLFMIQREIQNCILLQVAVADVNGVIFIREFCNAIQSNNCTASYTTAYKFIKADKRFKNPAYWIGIRYYRSTIKDTTNGAQ